MPEIILINPPVTKPSEPPAGIARLCGALGARGIGYAAADLNLEGLLWLLRDPGGHAGRCTDRWTARAKKNAVQNLSLIRGGRAAGNFDQYKKAVLELDRLASKALPSPGISLGITDYSDSSLSPLRSADLLAAARDYESNPFYPFFRERLASIIVSPKRRSLSLSKKTPGHHSNDNRDEKNPRWAGISVNYLGQALTAFAIAGYIRAEFPDVKIIMGGGLVTSWTGRAGTDLSASFRGLVDHFVAGPGEDGLLALLGKVNAGEVFRPDYTSFNLPEYLSPGVVLPYSTAAGCWWRKCSFCPEKAEGNRYAPLPPGRAVAEIGELCASHRPALIHFLDSTLNPAFLQKFIATPPGAPWYGFARISQQLADPEFCRGLSRSGCVMLKLGIESGDQRVLDELNKGIDLALVEKALRVLKEAGIATYVYLLFGTPPEDFDAARRTREFVLRNSDAIGFLNLAIFNLPLAAEDGRDLLKKEFYAGDLSLYADFEHPRGWDRKSVRRFLDKEFRREPAIAAILRRDPPFFTSNHAGFFKNGHEVLGKKEVPSPDA